MLQKLLPKNLSLYACLFILFASIYVIFNVGRWHYPHRLLNWDGAAYYSYLPAIVIYDDLFGLNYMEAMNNKYRFCGDDYGWMFKTSKETQKRFFKYSCGVAIFEIPFFFAAHGLTLWQGLPPDGYSDYYQLSVGLATIFYVFVGFLFLRKLLRAYFDELPTAMSLLVIFFATNLFYYTTIEQSLAHQYLFCLFAVLLWATHKWHETQHWKYALLIGITWAWATLTRPTEILVGVVPILWGVWNMETLRQKLNLVLKHYKQLGLIVLPFMFFMSLQLIYWKIATNHWVYYSYEKEGFDFTDPHILDGLFSYRIGWFLYNPLVLLGFFGTFFLAKDARLKGYVLPFYLYYVPFIYIVFSWWMWYYGGYSARVMIESLALLALPMAAFFTRLLSWGKSIQTLSFTVILLLTALNLFQSWQYSHIILHWCKTSKAYYWRVFLKTRVTDEDRRYLHPD